MPLCGGFSDVKEADDNVHQIVAQLKDELEGKIGRKFDQLIALQFRSQVVNGMNYLIKAKVSDDEHIHIRAHKPIRSETASLVAHKDKLSSAHPLEIFEF